LPESSRVIFSSVLHRLHLIIVGRNASIPRGKLIMNDLLGATASDREQRAGRRVGFKPVGRTVATYVRAPPSSAISCFFTSWFFHSMMASLRSRRPLGLSFACR
jgi:hypothetical protein